MSPIEETARFIQVPENLFFRVDLRRLSRKWPLTIQWFLALLIAAKVCRSSARVEANGVPVTVEDLDVIPAWGQIDPEFVRDCCKAGILGIDPLDGCIIIENRTQWIKYPSETKWAERKRASREAAEKAKSQTEPGSNGNVTATSRQGHGDVTGMSQQVQKNVTFSECDVSPYRTGQYNTGQDNTGQDRTGQYNTRSSSSGGGSEEGEGDEAGFAGLASRPAAEGTFPGDQSPRPPGNGLASAGQILGNTSAASPPPEPKRGPMSDAVLKKFRSLRSTNRLERAEQMAVGRWMAETAAAGISGEAIQAAAFAAVDQAAHESANRHLENPVNYARSLLEQHLENAVGRERANETLQSIGKTGAPYAWRPDG